MPKNNVGGNKVKKQGRKHTGDSDQKHTRFAKEDGEVYAVVTKIEGGSNCQVKCYDNISRLCIIRKKFKGKGKRDNSLSIGTWVLVGLRSWETTNSGREKCDLLEVYSSSDKNKILNYEKKIDLSAISCIDNCASTDNEDFINHNVENNEDNILFCDSDDSIDIDEI